MAKRCRNKRDEERHRKRESVGDEDGKRQLDDENENENENRYDEIKDFIFFMIYSATYLHDNLIFIRFSPHKPHSHTHTHIHSTHTFLFAIVSIIIEQQNQLCLRFDNF